MFIQLKRCQRSLSITSLFCGAFLFASVSHAACVNGLRQETPTSRFTLQADVVTDTHTGLMWQRCALGQQWQTEKSRCNLNLEQQRLFTWPQALEASKASPLGGYSDWRLPNKNELASIVERACTGPAINETVFPSTTAAEFWTSTPGRREGGYAWRINFKTGDILNIQTDQTYSVRLVRDAQ